MKGFISFALSLAIISILLFFTYNSATNQFILESTKNELIKAEQAQKERTLLENNFDKIVTKKLSDELYRENYNTKQVLNSVNSALEKYLKEKTYAGTIFGEKLGEVNLNFLNANSSIQTFKIKNVSYSEYVFTSNEEKTTGIYSKIGKEIILEFSVPTGYSIKIIKGELD